MKKVLLIQKSITHYRVPFFKALHSELQKLGIEFLVLYSEQSFDKSSLGNGELSPWSRQVKHLSLSLFGRPILLQFISPAELAKFDLIIIEHANQHLLNPVIFALRSLCKYKVAFWGHGRNLQSETRSSLSEAIKRRILHCSDWWFAYTGQTRQYLIDEGFCPEKITTVYNSTDTQSFKDALDQFKSPHNPSTAKTVEIESKNIGLFCGSMYRKRNLDFLVAAADRIRADVHDFHLLVAGDGAGSDYIKEAAKTREWLHYVGPVYGAKKAEIFSRAKLLLMPGVIGLVVVDSFVSGVPLITIQTEQHGPEVDYIEHGINGYLTAPDVESFSTEAIKLMCDDQLYETVRRNCLNSSINFSTEMMAYHFSNGIARCLGLT